MTEALEPTGRFTGSVYVKSAPRTCYIRVNVNAAEELPINTVIKICGIPVPEFKQNISFPLIMDVTRMIAGIVYLDGSLSLYTEGNPIPKGARIGGWVAYPTA